MADNSLDQFFAQKDQKKKNKKKSKFTTTQSIAQKLEEIGKVDDPRERIPTSSSSTPITSEQEDDEWKSIDEERDYTGLKIQSLSISDKYKEEEQSKEQTTEYSEETAKIGEGQIGPWKVVAPTSPTVEAEPEIETKADSPEKEVEESKPAVYKPPSMRGATPTTSSTRRHEKKYTPELTSELDFPSLSSAAKGKHGEGDKSFQSVKHGVKSKGESTSAPKIDLENKFSALPEND